MKPRLTKRYGVWRCLGGLLDYVVGYGYTPDEAYREWLRCGGVVR